MINRIRKSFKESDDASYQEKLISELKKYIDFHFTSEENIAASHSITENIRDHQQRHSELLEEFDHRAEDLDRGLKTIDEFIEFLSDWFVGHTIYEDQKLFGKIAWFLCKFLYAGTVQPSIANSFEWCIIQ